MIYTRSSPKAYAFGLVVLSVVFSAAIGNKQLRTLIPPFLIKLAAVYIFHRRRGVVVLSGQRVALGVLIHSEYLIVNDKVYEVILLFGRLRSFAVLGLCMSADGTERVGLLNKGIKLRELAAFNAAKLENIAEQHEIVVAAFGEG